MAQPAVYPKTGDNGRKRLQCFCDTCGSPLFATGEGADAAVLGLRWGSIVQRRELSPRYQIWCNSAVPWAADVTALPGVPTD